LHISGRVFIPDTNTRIPLSLVMMFNHNNKAYRWVGVDLDKKTGLLPGQWNTIETDYLSPVIRNTADPLNVYFWLREQIPQPIKVDALHVVAYERKD
jgi:hypothetical protein